MRLVRLLALLLFVLALAPSVAPYDPAFSDEVNYGKLHAPSAAHPFGTDKLARDLFSRVLIGSRISLEVATGAVIIALLVGTLYGTAAAMSGGWSDTLLMRTLDVLLAIPRILVLLPIAAFWQNIPLWTLAALIGLTGWFDTARLVRGDVQAVLARDWVLASRAMGVGRMRLVLRGIFPHLVPTLLIVGTLAIGTTIALEAGLGFLGLVSRSDAPSLGAILHDSLNGGTSYWWLTVFPGVTIVLIMLACNALGDALREAFAPAHFHA